MAKKRGKPLMAELQALRMLVEDMNQRHQQEIATVMHELVTILALLRAEYTEEAHALDQELDEEKDPLFELAKKIVIEAGKASSSYLQRTLEISYSRAARLIDALEQAGVVGPAAGAQPRQVYISNATPHVEKVLKKIASQMKKQKRNQSKSS